MTLEYALRAPSRRLVCLIALGLLLCGAPFVSLRAEAPAPTAAQAAALKAEQERFFEERVRPILANHCWKCHGPDKQESDLRLDSRAMFLKKSSYGADIAVPGQPTQGQILKAVRHDGDLKMPPEKKLADAQVEALESWIKMGMPWPESTGAAVKLGAFDRATGDRSTHWSYQTVVRPSLPATMQASRVRSPIDSLIGAKQDAARLAFSPEADRRLLARRLAFDLIGLPLDAETTDAFAADESPDAVVRLVDRLLASPRHGERWGRHWLDVARYADTKGYAFAQERRYPFAYTYRDYVVRSLNEDTPYDRFLLEQLAADQLEVGEENWRLAGLGFLTTGRRFNNAQDDIDDKIDVVGRGLLGLTVSCARCHDHKYDAIPMDDYYSLYGVFASCHEPGELPMIGTPVQNSAYQAYDAELKKLEAKRDEYIAKKRVEHAELARQRTTDYLARQLADKPTVALEKLSFLIGKPDDLRPKMVERWRDYLKKEAKPSHPVLGPWAELTALEVTDEPGKRFEELAAPVLERLKALPEGVAEGQINPLVKKAFLESPPTQRVEVARVYGQVLKQVHDAWKAAGGNMEAEAKLDEPARKVLQLLLAKDSPTDLSAAELKGILNRAEGNEQRELQKKIDGFQATSPGAPPRAMIVRDNAQPTTPHIFMRGNPARPGKQVPRQFLLVVAGSERKPFQHGSGRLELAQSIVSPNNPLTRRVIANRIWMYHMGEPLVSTPSDFGIRIDAPPQHALLDYLAAALLEHGWSLKSLHREIVLSATFAQASNDRPEARAIDPENRLLWRMNRKRLEFEPLRDALLAVSGQLDATLYGRPAEITRAPFSPRRSVYGYIDRQDLPNLFRVFDFASPDQSSERRPRTTVPQQALFLMNSPFVVDQAKSLVARLDAAGVPGDDARISELYRAVFTRSPELDELNAARSFIAAGATPQGDVKLSIWEQYAQLLLLTNEVAFID